MAELRGSQERARIGEGFFTVLDKVNIIHTESRVGHTSLPTSGQLAVTVVSPMFYVDPYPIFQLGAMPVLGLIKNYLKFNVAAYCHSFTFAKFPDSNSLGSDPCIILSDVDYLKIILDPDTGTVNKFII